MYVQYLQRMPWNWGSRCPEPAWVLAPLPEQQALQNLPSRLCSCQPLALYLLRKVPKVKENAFL